MSWNSTLDASKAIYDSCVAVGEYYIETVMELFGNVSATDGDTEIELPEMVAGACETYYRENPYADLETITGHYVFTTKAGTTLISYPHGITMKLNTGSGVSVSYSNNDLQINFPRGGADCTNGTASWTYDGYSTIITSSSGSSSFIGDSVDNDGIWGWYTAPDYSNKQGVPAQIYIPSMSGGTYSYNDVTNIILSQVNEELQEESLETVSEDDVPSWYEIIGEPEPDPTEPATGEGTFVFDYNEVISPTELEDILSQETYDIPEIHTDVFGNNIPTIEVEENTYESSALTSEMVGFIKDSTATGKNLMESYGIYSLFISVALVTVIGVILKGL